MEQRLKKDIELLECTQDRALRLGNKNHVYETLEERRNRAQLMETYKYLNTYYTWQKLRPLAASRGDWIIGESPELNKWQHYKIAQKCEGSLNALCVDAKSKQRASQPALHADMRVTSVTCRAGVTRRVVYT